MEQRARVPLPVAVAVALVGSVFLVLVALPRFGALSEPPNPALGSYTTADGTTIAAVTVDMREYLAAVEYFGGDGPAPEVAPFTRRVGATWLAGQLPLSAPVALNSVVVGALCVGLWALVATWRRLGLRIPAMVGATAVYAVAFPVFYWGSFNYVDGAVVGILAVLVYALVCSRPGLALAAIAVGVLTKESALVGLVAMVAWVWASPMTTRVRSAWTAGAFGAATAGVLAAAWIGPTATSTYNPWVPTPEDMAGYIGNNLHPTTLAQVFLTIAIPGAGVVLALRQRRQLSARWPRPVLVMACAGTLAGTALSLQSFLTAQLDGRTIWTTYPFAVTLAAMAVEERWSRRRGPAATGSDRVGGTAPTSAP